MAATDISNLGFNLGCPGRDAKELSRLNTVVKGNGQLWHLKKKMGSRASSQPNKSKKKKVSKFRASFGSWLSLTRSIIDQSLLDCWLLTLTLTQCFWRVICIISYSNISFFIWINWINMSLKLPLLWKKIY